jgi:hypothetical protein
VKPGLDRQGRHRRPSSPPQGRQDLGWALAGPKNRPPQFQEAAQEAWDKGLFEAVAVEALGVAAIAGPAQNLGLLAFQGRIQGLGHHFVRLVLDQGQDVSRLQDPSHLRPNQAMRLPLQNLW